MKTKIKVMSIQDLLQIPNLSDSFRHMVIFVSTKPNYYDFGWTFFRYFNIADTDAPVISDYAKFTLKQIGEHCKLYETVYVCCDAGLSRSPAIALYLAYKIKDSEQIASLKAKFRFLNQKIFEMLMRIK